MHPAAAVRGPKHVVTKGATPVLGSVPRRVGEEVVQDLELPVGQHALAGVRGDRPAETGSER